MDVANLAEFILPKTEPLDTDIKPSDILNKLQLSSTTCASEAVTASQPLNAATALQPAQAMNGSSDPMLTIPFSTSAMAALAGGSHNDPNPVPNLSFTDVNVTLTLQELLDPTSNAEDVLAVLTPEQLTVIEKTLNKVKRRKLNSLRKTREGGVIKGKPHHPPQHIVPKPPSPTATVSTKIGTTQTSTPQASFPPTPPATTLSDSHVPLLAYPLNLGFAQIPAALVTPPPDTTSGPVMLLPPMTGTSFGGGASSPAMVSPSMTATDLLVLAQIKQEPTMSTSMASSSDSALAETTASASPAQEQQQAHSIAAAAALSCHEPITEIKDGVEWVSFIYSHNRTLKQYSVRTDIDTVFVEELDERFKNDNCVYPRANLPRETYQGNRWAYETECNLLGWKLAWLNQHEISGKRGLIQRAVDSYRNRYPSMRSRRVARQEKLANGTLRKRKNRDGASSSNSSSNGSSGGDDEQNVKEEEEGDPGRGAKAQKIHHPHGHEQAHATGERHPKTFVIDNFGKGARCRLRINVDDVNLSEIDLVFKRNNCVYPRAAFVEPGAYTGCQSRWEEECECNELGWKLAWLNPRHLANKKALLQRALDLYRAKFVPNLRPRRSSRYRSFPTPPSTSLSHFPLSVAIPPHDLASSPTSSLHSCSSSTTDSLDFGDDLLSPPDLDNSVDVDTLLADTGSPDFEELLLMQDDDDDNEGRGVMGEEECGMGEGPMVDIERGLDGFSRTMVVAVMNHGDVTMGLGARDESENEGRGHQVMSHCDSGFGDLHDLAEVKVEDGDICGMGLDEEDELTTEELLSHLLK